MSFLASLFYVFIGGGIGSTLRFSLSAAFLKINFKLWSATLIVNVLGAMLMLFLNTKMNLSASQSNFIKVGLLGGLTTFSTFSYEILHSVRSGNYMEALLIFFLNIIFGIVIGIWVFR